MQAARGEYCRHGRVQAKGLLTMIKKIQSQCKGQRMSWKGVGMINRFQLLQLMLATYYRNDGIGQERIQKQ